jgi:hypothetical protein
MFRRKAELGALGTFIDDLAKALSREWFRRCRHERSLVVVHHDKATSVSFNIGEDGTLARLREVPGKPLFATEQVDLGPAPFSCPGLECCPLLRAVVA